MSDVYYDPFSDEIDNNPFPFYRRLRDEAPAYYNERYDFYALSRYADIRKALADPSTFSSAHGITLEDLGASAPPSMIMMDPPSHTKLRRLIGATFTPKRVHMLEVSVRDLARSLVDEFAPRGACDVVADYAAVLPMAVICELLGVPREDQRQMRRWSEAIVGRDDAADAAPDSAVDAGYRIQEYFEALVADRRGVPGEDIVTDLLRAEEGDEGLNHLDMIGFLWLLLIAGNDTSTRTIGNACFWLDHFADQRAAVAADPSLVAGAVEETLRYDGAVHMIVRTAMADTEIAGTTLRAGKKVGMLLASGNRDERRWGRPDDFDVRRDATGHLGFGHGIHHCLGATLGRLEARIGLEELIACIPEYAIDESSLRRARSNAFRGFRNLRIEFAPS